MNMFNRDPRSVELYKVISKLDLENGDIFEFKDGGEGDNGEHFMELLDMYFEEKDGPAECYEIGEDFIEFNLLDDGTHSASVERAAQSFLEEAGRVLLRVDGNHDTTRVRYIFTPGLEFEEAEE